MDTLESLAVYVHTTNLVGRVYDKIKFQSEMIGVAGYLRELPDDRKDDDTPFGMRVVGDLYPLFQLQPGLYDYVSYIFNKLLGLLKHSVRCEQYNSFLSNVLRSKTQRRMTVQNQVLNCNVGFNIHLFTLRFQLQFILQLFIYRHKLNQNLVKRFKSQINKNNAGTDDWQDDDDTDDSEGSVDLTKFNSLHFMHMSYPLQTADCVKANICSKLNVDMSLGSDLDAHTRKYKPKISSKYFKSKLISQNNSNNENNNDNSNGNWNRFIVQPSRRQIKNKQSIYSRKIKFNSPLFRRSKKSNKTKQQLPVQPLSQPIQSGQTKDTVSGVNSDNDNDNDNNDNINNDNEVEDYDIGSLDKLNLPPLSFGTIDPSNDGNSNGIGSQNSKASHVTLEQGTIIDGMPLVEAGVGGLSLSQPDIAVVTNLPLVAGGVGIVSLSQNNPSVAGAAIVSSSQPPRSMPVLPPVPPPPSQMGCMNGMTVV